jgi:transposase
MEEAFKRHDISDHAWAKLGPLLPGQKGQHGGIAKDNRQFINGVSWIIRTGAPWRDLPPAYGNWNSVHRRFLRWQENGTWDRIRRKLINDPDFEWLMIDASHSKAHAHAAGAQGGSQDIGLTKGGSIRRYI